jgi:hypothetical protein
LIGLNNELCGGILLKLLLEDVGKPIGFCVFPEGFITLILGEEVESVGLIGLVSPVMAGEELKLLDDLFPTLFGFTVMSIYPGASDFSKRISTYSDFCFVFSCSSVFFNESEDEAPDS